MNNKILRYASQQQILFSDYPKRLALSSLVFSDPLRPLTLRVHRNHSFEAVESILRPYLSFAGYDLKCVYSEYDDSLAFSLDGESDVELVWIDTRRYKAAIDVGQWLVGRLTALRAQTTAPILVVAVGDTPGPHPAPAMLPPGVYMADLSDVIQEVDGNFFDDRNEFAGTGLANKAITLLAREFGCRWLPPLLRPGIKGVVLDLDNTLYSGVLGEDGLNVVLTEEHRNLQETCRQLKEKGMFLALCSRNEEIDVRGLFAARSDFPLRLDDFTTCQINWNEKSENIIAIANALNIGTDSLLFVDDNMGELLSVQSLLPEVRLVHAGADPSVTARAIAYYPGVWKWNYSQADAVRTADLKSNAERTRLLESEISPEEYFRQLGTKLTFFINPHDQLSRMAEISNKTNQFNLAFKRYAEQNIAALLESPGWVLATFALQDNLSDSGVIGLIVARKNGVTAVVEELCVSCRALGRRLEDSMILRGIRLAMEKLGCENAVFVYETRERNQPALQWLAKHSNNGMAESGVADIRMIVPEIDSLSISIIG